MAMFLSILLTMGFAFWFYKTAQRLHANSVQWSIVGAFAYQLPAWAWMLMVSKPYLSSLQGTAKKSSMSAGLIGHTWLLVGITVALLVYRFALLKTTVRDEG